MKEDHVYLRHIAEAITTIQEYVSTGRDDFFAKKMIQDAVIRNLEIIGEAVKNISSCYSPEYSGRSMAKDCRFTGCPHP